MNTKLFKNNNGITMIELMGVLVIIGIISVMAVPRFQKAMERLDFRSANREITSTLRLARSLAITEKESYGIYFDGSGGQLNLEYILFKDISNPTSYTYDSGDSVVKIHKLPKEFTLLVTDLTDNVMIFQPNGSVKFTGGGNIVTLASTQDLVGINDHNVLASTGRVKTTQYYY